MNQGTRNLREKAPHYVPHSAKGEEGQPVPEKAPGPLGLPPATGEGVGPQAASGNIMTPCHPRTVMALSWL